MKKIALILLSTMTVGIMSCGYWITMFPSERKELEETLEKLRKEKERKKKISKLDDM